ncbi:hypothetical protein EVAR_55804_1 [Eumeta japonica]|uniref:Uncharacterized protein n=1 Tax=Eumeta variegata TaxID=151549 RepID=A0A4C1YTE1_EUMVA|nr:hypothetical protein EVAR_55804_1 [Eumeta japonica]
MHEVIARRRRRRARPMRRSSESIAAMMAMQRRRTESDERLIQKQSRCAPVVAVAGGVVPSRAEVRRPARGRTPAISQKRPHRDVRGDKRES